MIHDESPETPGTPKSRSHQSFCELFVGLSDTTEVPMAYGNQHM